LEAARTTGSKPIIALIGNPNSGKTSVFNQLTGLQQKVGNFPGVTVDKKSGDLDLGLETAAELVDFPGTYSLYPTSKDEKLVVQTLSHPHDENFPDAILYVADVTKLEKHLLLFTQLRDLNIPILLALNMRDLAEQDGLQYDLQALERKLSVPVVFISGRTGLGMDDLKLGLANLLLKKQAPAGNFYQPSNEEKQLIAALQPDFPGYLPYQLLLLAHHQNWLPYLKAEEKAKIAKASTNTGFQDLQMQVHETMQRYGKFTPMVAESKMQGRSGGLSFTERLDRVLTNRVFGPLIFFSIMLLVFQSLFAWAEYPMTLIEDTFGQMGQWCRYILGSSMFTDLLVDGFIAGLGGIVVFVPQIAILFFLISLLEEVGYMARAAFMFDRVMQIFGLNGRSVVALISGGACAIPAIMSTRTIGNWKERLITILVTPFISCSARIPVYTVLIGFVVPAQKWGWFSMQAWAFMGLYLLGIVAALLAAFVLKLVLKTNEVSYLMLEMPPYRWPVMRNVWLTVWEKVKTFVIEAGRIILIISLVLWVLASFGPGQAMQKAEDAALVQAKTEQLDEDATEDLVAASRMEASYAGLLGKAIEPAIKPLGFDWKIGIALITSFAAREVFVATMATIYSIGHRSDEYSVRERMAKQKNPITGQKVYNAATSLSLLLFYVFAMQCMSTLAVVRRETKSWKWPLVQFTFMTALAYFASWLAYTLLS
jgi:ferrous iron transport protein B